MNVTKVTVTSGFNRRAVIEVESQWTSSRADLRDVPHEVRDALIKWLLEGK